MQIGRVIRKMTKMTVGGQPVAVALAVGTPVVENDVFLDLFQKYQNKKAKIIITQPVQYL